MEKRIGIGPRGLACIFDFIFILIGCWFTGPYLQQFLGITLTSKVSEKIIKIVAEPSQIEPERLVGMILGVLFFMVLFSIWEGITGASPGKLLCNLRIRTETGKPASQEQLMIRSFIKYHVSFIQIIYLMTGIHFLLAFLEYSGVAVFIGFLLVLQKDRQGLHDKLTQTAVFSEEDILLSKKLLA